MEMHAWFAAMALAFAPGAQAPVTADACVASVPVALRDVLAKRMPDVRLPLTTDSAAEDRKIAAAQGNACLLVTTADFDGNGRADFVLVMPRFGAPGYRLVVALDSPRGFEVTNLASWNERMTNLYVAPAKPGRYSHTEAYAYRPEPGSVEKLVSKRVGFWFGEVEGGADVYVLHEGHLTFVHAID
jgi:hypothetical protein